MKKNSSAAARTKKNRRSGRPRLSSKSGLAPGTPVHIGRYSADSVSVAVTKYGADSHDVRDLESVAQLTGPEPGSGCLWVRVTGVHDVQAIADIGSKFGLHGLTVEDIVNTTQRPKIDIYDDYIFVVVRDPLPLLAKGQPRTDQISLILGPNFLISFQQAAGPAFDAVAARLAAGRTRIRQRGAGYLLYALLDATIDHYFTVLESLGERIDDLEDAVLDDARPATNRQIHVLRREVVAIRRAVWPLREVVNTLRNEECTELVGPATRIYLNDLQDHSIQVLDMTDSFREAVSGMLDIYLSSLSNRMNEIMKVLTIFSTIFIPMTLITGIYGMNFNPARSPFNMPELSWYFGYPLALGLMAFVAIVMLIFLKRRQWL